MKHDRISAIDGKDEKETVEDRGKLPPKLLYEVIRQDGEEELARTHRSLVWSGIAAGIMISLSVLGEAILRTHLPDQKTSYLIENFGYTLGFVVVIFGRMQLFTENTITTVLPFLHAPSLSIGQKVLSLWCTVLAANVAGCFLIASLFAFTPALPSDLVPALVSLSEHAMGFEPAEAFFRGIPAGILIAAIVWMLPQAKGGAGLLLVIIFTWLIAAGDFTHIVAGSVEMAFLMVRGSLEVWHAVTHFFAPVFAGNVIGGTVIFSLMAYGQVRDDMKKV